MYCVQTKIFLKYSICFQVLFLSSCIYRCVCLMSKCLMAARLTYTIHIPSSSSIEWICVCSSIVTHLFLSFSFFQFFSHSIFTFVIMFCSCFVSFVCVYVFDVPTLLEQKAFAFLLLFHLQCSSSGGFEDFTDTLLRFGRTFQVSKCIYLLGHCSTLLWLHRLLLHFRQFLDAEYRRGAY